MHKVNDWKDEVSDWEKLESDVYIAAQIPAISVNPSMVFVVGDGKTYGDYENKQLSDGQKYKIYSRGLDLRVTKVARLTVVVDISLCHNRLFFKATSGTKIWLTFSISLEPKCKTQESGQNIVCHSLISHNTSLGPGSTVGNERHLKKIGQQSELTAGYDYTVFTNQNSF